MEIKVPFEDLIYMIIMLERDGHYDEVKRIATSIIKYYVDLDELGTDLANLFTEHYCSDDSFRKLADENRKILDKIFGCITWASL